MNRGLRVVFGATALLVLGASCHAALGLDGLELVDDETSSTGDPPPSVAGHPGADFVAAGGVVESPKYRMVFTLGQQAVDQGSSESPNYRHEGGLVGVVADAPQEVAP